MKIIHARCSEKGTANGKKGDTNNEVCVSNYYEHKLGWYFLEPYNPSLKAVMVKYALLLANNDKVGYGQSDRLTLLEQLKKNDFNVDKIDLCNCDCSSFIRAVIILACRELNINCEKIYNFTTANEKYVLLNSGLFYVSSYKNNGTIAVTKTKGHTVLLYDDKLPIANSSKLPTANSLTEIAKEVIKGKYGNGATRKKNIESLGYNYNEVQKEVNRLLRG